jgi:hypothetical protein
MTDDDIRRVDDDNQQAAAQAEQSGKDRFLDAIRDMPRMSTLGPEGDGSGEYSPPPPMVARIGGVSQGCSGVILALIGLPMVLVAVIAGFYVWGPTLMLIGAFVLLLGSGGVWAGKRNGFAIGIPVLIGMSLLLYFWGTLIPVTARLLTVLGSMVPIYLFASQLLSFLLLATLFLHVITLFYWQRLKGFQRTRLVAWGVGIAVLIAAALIFHVVQQQQRESWIDDHRADWQAAAPADPRLMLGANSNVMLGYSFINSEDDDDTALLNDRIAELAAFQEGFVESDADLRFVRVGASGDVRLERQEPYMYKDGDVEDRAARLDRQQQFELEYVNTLQAIPDVSIVLADWSYSAYWLVRADNSDAGEISWNNFTQAHVERIRYYAEKFAPAAYEVVVNPSAYGSESAIDEPSDEAEGDAASPRLKAWVIHTDKLIREVRRTSPQTAVGITIDIVSDFDKDYYAGLLDPQSIGLDPSDLLALDPDTGALAFDYVGVRIHRPGDFELVEELFTDYGNPVEYGKQAWIVETWHGYCVAPQRSMDLDAMWMDAALAFAAKEQITGVLVNDAGCFLQPGGTLYTEDVDRDGRTQVWRKWRDLLAEWPAPSYDAIITAQPDLWDALQSMGDAGE